MKKVLIKKIWSRGDYYKVAAKGSLDFSHPAMKKLTDMVLKSTTILDMGCGEGTRLNKLVTKNQKGYGIDISSKAIKIAKRQYPQLNFKMGDLEKLPFDDNKFDLVYSAFVFEHLDNPEKVINEGIRVLKRGGQLLIVAPNFGAPNRASPPSKENRFFKLLKGLLFDFLPVNGFSWNKVKPIADKKNYEIDWDTTIEPYLGSLIRYLKSVGMKVSNFSSCWEEEKSNASVLQNMVKRLGKSNIYPFNLWGPHLLVIAEKNNENSNIK